MTNNSIQFMKNLETKRHDEAMEVETNRNNMILEAIRQKEYEETARANRASEAIRTTQNVLESRNLGLAERDLVRKGKDSSVQRKATKQSTRLTKQQIKTEKSKRKTEASKRKTESVNRAATKKNLEFRQTELNQAAQRLALDYAKFGLDEDINVWKEEVERAKAAASQDQANAKMKKAENDLLIAAFKDPKLLAYLGLATPEGQKAVEDAIENLSVGGSKTATWMFNNISKHLVAPPAPVKNFLDKVQKAFDNERKSHSTGGTNIDSGKRSEGTGKSKAKAKKNTKKSKKSKKKER